MEKTVIMLVANLVFEILTTAWMMLIISEIYKNTK